MELGGQGQRKAFIHGIHGVQDHTPRLLGCTPGGLHPPLHPFTYPQVPGEMQAALRGGGNPDTFDRKVGSSFEAQLIF